MIPDDLRYTAEHEWIRSAEGDAGPVRIGITDYAQEQLGDIVYVSLPEVGATVTAGDAVGELESTKSVSDLFAPVSGTVTAVNEALGDAPETINSDPYGDGWVMELDPSDADQLSGLLAADAYKAHTESD